MIRNDVSEAGPAVPARVVRLIVGSLDGSAVRELRDLLRHHAAAPSTRLEIDLSQVDQEHPLALFVLLSNAQQRGRADGTELVVLMPPVTMIARLTAVGLRIQRDPLMPPALGTVIRVGRTTLDLTDSVDPLGAAHRPPS